jgi:hypothetical protein
MTERKEAWMRLFVLIISGIILTVWKWLIILLAIVNWVYVMFVGKRIKEIAKMSEIWNTQWYIFQRYIIFVTNRRPFPFAGLEKSMSKYEHR